MTEAQRTRLVALLPAMRTNARRAVSQNDYQKAFLNISGVVDFLRGDSLHMHTAEEWISIAEKAAEGHDKPGTIRMTMAQVQSGLPPEITA